MNPGQLDRSSHIIQEAMLSIYKVSSYWLLYLVEFLPDGFEVRIGSDPLDEVVGLPLLLDDRSGLVRQDPDLLVTLLTTPAMSGTEIMAAMVRLRRSLRS